MLFFNKLALISGLGLIANNSIKVDSMKSRTAVEFPLPDMSCARYWPDSAANDRQIFVFADWLENDYGAFTSEFYESGAGK